MLKYLKDGFRIVIFFTTVGYAFGTGFHLAKRTSHSTDILDAYDRGRVDGLTIATEILKKKTEEKNRIPKVETVTEFKTKDGEVVRFEKENHV